MSSKAMAAASGPNPSWARAPPSCSSSRSGLARHPPHVATAPRTRQPRTTPSRVTAACRRPSPPRPCPDPQPPPEAPLDRLLVATLNILNLADRWEERLPLLLADMAALQPDVIGLQEVVYPLQQDRLLGAAGEGRYEVVRGWAGRPEYGNSLLVKAPLAASDPDRLDLGLQRAAHRVL